MKKLRDFVYDLILEDCNQNVTEVADFFGVSIQTIYNYLNKKQDKE